MKWRLYASLYAAGDEIEILDNEADDDRNDDEDQKEEKKEDQDGIQYNDCNKCKAPITSRDITNNNISWSSELQTWEHDNCQISSYNVPKLTNTSKDEFNKLMAYKSSLIISDDGHTFTTNEQNVYQTVFGVTSVKTGVKIWNININAISSRYSFIGIIDNEHINHVNLYQVMVYTILPKQNRRK